MKNLRRYDCEAGLIFSEGDDNRLTVSRVELQIGFI